MKKYGFILGAAALIVVLSFRFFSTEDIVRNYPSAGTDIIAFGDSLVQGVGATAGNDFVSLLSREVGQPIVNFGVSGNTTADGLARIGELDRYRPKIVILLLGGNDHLRKVPETETFANLAALIENIQARGAVVLLLGIRGSLLGDKFEEEFERLHEEYQTAYVSDVLSGLFGRAEYMSDPIHPNDAGYAKIAERIAPVLELLLK
ncbi:MAG: hypothetical protein A3C93_05530 [Candidatus Lloydbacteria bacterium RIFCSPHIGHO2_02_FULL_54_17]|uniref:SGNH hydrolase-type esterase domain-containing protein n=1 Tax=Candidatus Lloydbacteria bacterium RIFCSPHIGHO2_02_FULL_54_17 TaxID=1798664 RepID=A0A1G2DAT8_9BACT|nr:MAG: hypothetical protein A3C93_05530 [Candidatus Lloydbacteria bacterium RIFCSPHIGHO2_02_FULL_54_17]OGZ13050.1 MAG: hypothetical protein A2948_03510 [Candidatus Lloydbacteria bacterium RIFCSPLOWO2_01_FULL_54_18]OGZ16498.1 MAG: hypothetical protein A3H76_04370 [Candidatus Lloydbacteria bacterium RIFCSPLOWO2_02_FULL_54_12]